MEKRTYNTTEKRIWHKNLFWVAVVLSFFHLTFHSWAWVSEKIVVKPPDFPDLSHDYTTTFSYLVNSKPIVVMSGKFEQYVFVSGTIKINNKFCRKSSVNQPWEFECNKDGFPVDLSHLIMKPQQSGIASWYDYSLKNYPNYSKNNFTAASRDYPRGTRLKVCIKVIESCGQGFEFIPNCVDVRVNDYVENPDVTIDLSSAAFKQLAPLSIGLIEVEISKID